MASGKTAMLIWLNIAGRETDALLFTGNLPSMRSRRRYTAGLMLEHFLCEYRKKSVERKLSSLSNAFTSRTHRHTYLEPIAPRLKSLECIALFQVLFKKVKMLRRLQNMYCFIPLLHRNHPESHPRVPLQPLLRSHLRSPQEVLPHRLQNRE